MREKRKKERGRIEEISEKVKGKGKFAALALYSTGREGGREVSLTTQCLGRKKPQWEDEDHGG